MDSRKIFHLDLTNLGVVFLLLFKGKPVVQKIIGQISHNKKHETKDFIFSS